MSAAALVRSKKRTAEQESEAASKAAKLDEVMQDKKEIEEQVMRLASRTRDPLTNEIMIDPVITPAGGSMERNNWTRITAVRLTQTTDGIWHNSCPVTNMLVPLKELGKRRFARTDDVAIDIRNLASLVSAAYAAEYRARLEEAAGAQELNDSGDAAKVRAAAAHNNGDALATLCEAYGFGSKKFGVGAPGSDGRDAQDLRTHYYFAEEGHQFGSWECTFHLAHAIYASEEHAGRGRNRCEWAADLFEQATRDGNHPLAMLGYAVVLTDGKTTAPNHPKAARLLDAAVAESVKDSVPCNSIAEAEVMFRAGCYFLDAACDSGHPLLDGPSGENEYTLGGCIERALTMLGRAAEFEFDFRASVLLGFMHLQGLGCSQDHMAALGKWWEAWDRGEDEVAGHNWGMANAYFKNPGEVRLAEVPFRRYKFPKQIPEGREWRRLMHIAI